MQIHIRYFAALREAAGKQSETRDTQAESPTSLYAELASEYRFALPLAAVKVAVNEEFVPVDHPLQPEDSVVFIPPVAGG